MTDEIMRESECLVYAESGNGRNVKTVKCPICLTPMDEVEESTTSSHMGSHDWEELMSAQSRHVESRDQTKRESQPQHHATP